jgi:steroid 5-alpha reductase family enzyme
MYGTYSSSTAAKALVTTLHVVAVALAAWFLFAGIDTAAGWFGIDADHADSTRRVLLIVLSLVYLGRFMVTTFITLKRTMEMSEACTVGVWVLIIHATMAITGGTNPTPAGIVAWLGVALYLLGSYLNTGSELQRLVWKKRPENRGKLYTGGLFRVTMHPNYLGDVTLFAGFALVTGTIWAFAIPIIMASMFIFINIPMLDKYLGERYGEAFDQYAAKTAKLVPFVY